MRRLHDLLLFLRAFPDDAALLAACEQALRSFASRRDLRRFRDELEGSGVAGTAIVEAFFHPTAARLAARHPGRLTISWASFEDEEELAPLVALLLLPEEIAWWRESSPGARRALAAVAARGKLGGAGATTDAEALLARLAALPGDELLREALHDRVGPFYRLDAAGSSTRKPPSSAASARLPNRTTPRLAGAPVVFRRAPFDHRRPDLAAELGRPPVRAREARGSEASELVELARDAMAARSRDLDCFAYGDARDVRRIEHEDGLSFVAIGSRPARRLALSSAYGLLTVRNGVPTGYVQLDGFLGTTLVHFNVFDAFRGADSAWVFARTLATARLLFGSDAFAIEPYQLGHHNDEALDSGAWWFYRKLGFAPRRDESLRLARAEARRLRRAGPGARTPRETLAELARVHLVWEPIGRAATIPPHAAIARVATEALTRSPFAVAAARTELAERAAALTRLDGARLRADERLWLDRWASMLLALPGVASWSPGDRRALGELVRAKAARRESELVRASRAHPRFGPALLELARRHGAEADLAPAS